MLLDSLKVCCIAAGILKPKANQLNFEKALMITTLDHNLTRSNFPSSKKPAKSISLFTIGYWYKQTGALI